MNPTRWNDVDSAGKPIEVVGIAPEVELDVPVAEFTAVKDPVLDAALAHLRKTPKKDRKPGKRG